VKHYKADDPSSSGAYRIKDEIVRGDDFFPNFYFLFPSVSVMQE
jgi:hypothetical protein